MKVTVLYFAAVRELAGVSEEQVEMPPGACIGDLRPVVSARHPALTGRLDAVRIARNEVFAADGDVVTEGDVLALIPPVAGG